MTEYSPQDDQHLEDETADTSDTLEWLEGETEEEAITRINKETGRNFKDFGDVVKNIKNADSKIAELGRQPKVTPSVTPTSYNDLETLFFESRPEAERVKEDLTKIAQSKGISVLQAWKEESWLQDKATALVREEQRKANDAKKVIPPSGSVTQPNDYLNMTDEEILNLPPEEAGKAFKAKAGRL